MKEGQDMVIPACLYLQDSWRRHMTIFPEMPAGVVGLWNVFGQMIAGEQGFTDSLIGHS